MKVVVVYFIYLFLGKLNLGGEIDYEAVVSLAEGFNGADLRNICTEAGKIDCSMDSEK